MVAGQNGIMTKAMVAKKQQCHATVKENISSYQADAEMSNVLQGKSTKVKNYLLDNGYAIDKNGMIELNVDSIVKNAPYGKGTNKKDVYTYEAGNLYYYDKNGNQEFLMEIEEPAIADLPPTDDSYFEITDDGIISVIDGESYYKQKNGYENFPETRLIIPESLNGITVTRNRRNKSTKFRVISIAKNC